MYTIHGWTNNIESSVAELDSHSARVRQLLDEAYAMTDFIAEPALRYLDGVHVLLHRPPTPTTLHPEALLAVRVCLGGVQAHALACVRC